MEDLTKNSVQVRQSSALDAAGKLTRSIEVSYKLGAHGPFTVVLPAEQFTAAAVNQAIEKMKVELTGVTA